jgi:hypothetical protein
MLTTVQSRWPPACAASGLTRGGFGEEIVPAGRAENFHVRCWTADGRATHERWHGDSRGRPRELPL